MTGAVNTMSRNEILSLVRRCLASSLAIKETEILPSSRLINDLGADSLDFLDILFSLERKLGVKLRNRDLDSLLRADFVNQKLVEDAYIPVADIQRLSEWLPALKDAGDPAKITPRALFSYITVESLLILIERTNPKEVIRR
jgi:acyl carrier protein